MRHLRLSLALALLGALLIPAAPAHAASAPDEGFAFKPAPWSKPLYGSKAPEDDPETQQAYIEGHDGTDLYIETYLPAPAGDEKPPAKVPTVMIMTPYAALYSPLNSQSTFIEYMNARGYAVALAHVRGSGNSGGCLEQTGPNQIKDGARFVEYLGKKAPWSNGKVGMYGVSYDAETQISTAGLGDPKKTKYLKAIVPVASVGNQYDWNFFDGVSYYDQPISGNTSYFGISFAPEEDPTTYPQHAAEKGNCQGEVMGSSADGLTGDYTEYWQQREYRKGAHKVKAATLMVHGLRDFNVQDITLAGFFDRLSPRTPHKGLFGVWQHAEPDGGSIESQWQRTDWMDMVTAWYDRYLKGKDTNVERWPNVQVQDNTGQWMALNEFPARSGRMGQLALGANGELGTTKPKGDSTFTEQMHVDYPGEGESVVFETKALKKPLHLVGQPLVDLWVQSSTDDAHIGVSLEVINADGEPASHSSGEAMATYGARSLQHIEEFKVPWFSQEAGEPISPGEAYRVTVRTLPTSLLVEKGQSLRLTVAGSMTWSKGTTSPSFAGSEVTILHDCNHASVLRFRIPEPGAKLINAREGDDAKVANNPARAGRRDGGGLASARVCGGAPIALAWQ